MAGKRYFCKLDCSEAYHCLKMAHEQSIQLLSFIFASKTLAYKRLAQEINRSLSVFTSFKTEYLHPIVKTDSCAQNIDDIGVAAQTPRQLIQNIKLVFHCIDPAGLKLSMDKCSFGQSKSEFMGKTISSQGNSPIEHKIRSFLRNDKPPTTAKSLQCYIKFLNFFRQHLLNLVGKLISFYKILQKD